MGSWNGTCGVSQLPIMYNDDVAIFLMKENKYNKEDHIGCVHSDNFYEPVSPAIFGKYDDYGRVRVENADSRVIRNLYGEDADLDDVGMLIDKESEGKGLFIMLVHLELYEELVSHYGERRRFYTEGLPFAEFMKSEMLDYLTIVKRDSHSFHIELDRNHFKRSLGYSMINYQFAQIYQDDFHKDPLIDSIVNLLTFEDAMQLSRKLWIPQAGQGSQDYELDVAKMIGAYAIKKEAEDNEDY